MHHYLPDRSPHQEYNTTILGNKEKIISKVSEVIFYGRHIILKENICGHILYCRRIKTASKISWGIPK